jgi:hypothetical protein
MTPQNHPLDFLKTLSNIICQNIEFLLPGCGMPIPEFDVQSDENRLLPSLVRQMITWRRSYVGIKYFR